MTLSQQSRLDTQKSFASINPATEEFLHEYPHDSSDLINRRLEQSMEAWEDWKSRTVSDRAHLVSQLGIELGRSRDGLARLISTEMGKPIAQARAEIEKCGLLCNYYREHGPAWLKPQHVAGNSARKSYIRFDPLGAVLAVMPWNFPFWQVLRFAVPTLLAGNAAILKHAGNVMGCAVAIEKLFLDAGFPEGIFLSLKIDRHTVPQLLGRSFIKAVTLTGSETAGSAIAEVAGRHLKKCVMELGGSDPFIVLPDADLDLAITQGVQSRLQNNGQSCIAAKRFIVHAKIYQQFVDGMCAAMKEIRLGDPLDEKTQLGPLARRDLRESLHQQVRLTLEQGAKLCTGGTRPKRPGWFFEPTLLSDVTPDMTAFREETFGPVAAVTSFRNTEEAIAIANRSNFGLGASIWTSQPSQAEEMARQIESGNVFINSMTKSDPSMPFGGVKLSGFGRELGSYGLHEFVNIKTVWVG